MSIPGAASPLFIGAAAAAEAGFQIDRSLRFNADDGAKLTRTFSSAGNRKTFTYSCWVKRAEESIHGTLFARTSSQSDRFVLAFFQGNLYFFSAVSGTTVINVNTADEFRDSSAWYHIVFAWDTTQSTANDRTKFYVNGVQVTNLNYSNQPSLNYEAFVNTAAEHTIGHENLDTDQNLNGYLAETHFIDGQALAPTDFGETDDNNNWNPKAYAGTYGTNGFHLDFSDNSSNAALGTDSSGNSNTWTVNNLVATAPGLETANQGFDVVTYTGNGGTQSISSLAFQPDFVWIKARGHQDPHALFDVIRGVQKRLSSELTNAEVTSPDGITSFDSNGFTMGANGSNNANNLPYVAWAWKAGGTASSNTDGSITSSVSANTTYGFSIASYTGNGTSGATIGHGLSAAPKWIIVKRRNSTAFWEVFHTSVGNTKVLYLNNTDAETTSSASWNNTSPTSSVFSVGNSSGTNASGSTYIAYCWSEVSGFSKFGSYTGNASATGPVVSCGFKPQFLLIKRTDGGSWTILDSKRDPTNPTTRRLFPDTSDVESVGSNGNVDFTNDGFQIKTSHVGINNNGSTHIFAAFAGKPDESVIDSLIDTPTNGTQTDTGAGGQVVGNYATLNPLSNTAGALSNGNLDQAGTTGINVRTESTMAVSSGKWYFEVTPTALSGTYASVGIGQVGVLDKYPGEDANSYSWYPDYVHKQNNATAVSYGSAVAVNGVVMVAFDLDNNKVFFGGGGTWFDSSDPAAGTNAAYAINAGTYTPIFRAYDGSSAFSVNFGQRPFAYTAPSGYKALCTRNLPDPTIADGSTAMDIALYAGDNSTRSITGLGFSPDMVWIKNRSQPRNPNIWDIVRGAGTTIGLSTNTTNSESDYVSNDGYLSAFNSDGFTVVAGSNANGNVNSSSNSYVGWTWDAGTSTVSNTDGSITSSVRANASAGFSIVSWTGNDITGESVGHGLNAKPALVIIKNRDTATDWVVNSEDYLGNRNKLYLNKTDAVVYDGQSYNATSSVVYLKGSDEFNGNGDKMICYCFAPVAGYSAVGSYTGNGSADGPFVYTGFRPRWVMIKRTQNADGWLIMDAARNTYNVADFRLEANSSGVETDSSVINVRTDFLSNGLKLRGDWGGYNQNGEVFFYAAFASHPFKTARAR